MGIPEGRGRLAELRRALLGRSSGEGAGYSQMGLAMNVYNKVGLLPGLFPTRAGTLDRPLSLQAPRTCARC